MTDTPWYPPEMVREVEEMIRRTAYVDIAAEHILTALTPYVRAVVEQAVRETNSAALDKAERERDTARAEALEQAANTAWVIEHAQESESFYPIYYCGCMPVWSGEHLKAIRFSRKGDAERLVGALGLPGLVRLHVWVDRALAAPKEGT